MMCSRIEFHVRHHKRSLIVLQVDGRIRKTSWFHFLHMMQSKNKSKLNVARKAGMGVVVYRYFRCGDDNTIDIVRLARPVVLLPYT